MSLTLELPDEDEILSIIKEAIEPYSTSITNEWDENDYKKLPMRLLGLAK